MKQQLSTEELLKLVEDSKNTKRGRKSPSYTRKAENIDRFISEVGIQSGTTKVPSCVIFYHYRKIWMANADNRDKCNKIAFFKTFSPKFVQYRTGQQRYYLLNDVFDLSDEMLKKAELYDKTFWKAKKQVLPLKEGQSD